MMSNIDRHPKCHMRTALGNCDPIGGFCTSVNEPICEALHKVSRSQGDFVSRQYLLAEIDDLVDEFSELDENGLHSERWCGIMDSKGIIMNTPSVANRPQGEWIGEADGYYNGELVYDTWYCSNCDYVVDDDEPPTWNYCPHCGADMRGKGDE